MAMFKSRHGVRWINWDFLMGVLSFFLAYLFSPYENVETLSSQTFIKIFAFAFFLSLSSRLIELPRPGYDFHISRYEILATAFLVVLVSCLLFLLMTFFMAYYFKARYVLVYAALIAYVLITVPRVILTNISNKTPMKLALLGSDQDEFSFSEEIVDSPSFKVVASSSNWSDVSKGCVNKDNIDAVIVCTNEDLDGHHLNELMDLPFKGIEVLTKGAFIEKYLRYIDIHNRNIHWLTSFSTLSFDKAAHTSKRFLDLFVSSLILLGLLPFLPLIAILIKLDSRGPVFYRQERVGLFNKKFLILKFRTMRTDAEKDGAQWASQEDDRVTRFGKFMRYTRIDEFPQFWNVLKGDMAIVGPRPERPEFEEMLIEKVPFYTRRHLVQPGITGWAQIKFKYGADLEDAKKKLQYDLYYIKHMSFVLDLKIFLKTFVMVMKGSR